MKKIDNLRNGESLYAEHKHGTIASVSFVDVEMDIDGNVRPSHFLVTYHNGQMPAHCTRKFDDSPRCTGLLEREMRSFQYDFRKWKYSNS